MSAAPRLGDPMPPLRRVVSRETIFAYADASGDHNPLHVDDEFAAKTPFGGIIAHGMLSVAYVSQAMHRWLGEGWTGSEGRAGGSGLSVAFLKPVRPGDELLVTGTVRECETAAEGLRVTCDVEVKNQHEETVLAGSAWGHWLRAGRD